MGLTSSDTVKGPCCGARNLQFTELLGLGEAVVDSALLSLSFEHVLGDDGGHFVDAVFHFLHMLDGGVKWGQLLFQGLLCLIQEAMGPSPKQELEWCESS